MGPGGGLVVALAEKASLLGSQFDSKQCRQQFVNPLSCFPQSRCNYFAFRISVLRLLLDLDTYGVVDPFGVSSISKECCGYYCSKTKYNFSLAHPSGIVSGMLAVC